MGVVLGLLASSYAIVSFICYSHSARSLGIGLALGFGCAFICSVAIFVFCYSAVFAYFIRKRNLPPTWCSWVGTPFLVVGFLILAFNLFSLGGYGGLAGLFSGIAILATNACRKLAYPAVTPKQPFD
jgi:hypothetical protein